MKVSNWKKKVASSLVAAGLGIPAAHADVVIPLADPSFEAYNTVPLGGAGSQYAYANKYRPTSAWIDDQDHNALAYIQDNAGSNWLYSSAYAETGGNHRGSPRTGNQAMHGFFKYSSQETAAVFEAGMKYTFSLWAQGNVAAALDLSGANSLVWMYIFDGSVPFSESASLNFPTLTSFSYVNGDFLNRAASDSAAQSQAKWTKLSVSFTTRGGESYLGKPVGVGFYIGSRVSVDDASLVASSVPEASSFVALAAAGITGFAIKKRRA